jgi:TolB-like protein
MPFQNMTNDTTWNIWQDGIQFNLVTSLSNSPDLKVRQTESTNNLLQSKGFDNYALLTQLLQGLFPRIWMQMFLYMAT